MVLVHLTAALQKVRPFKTPVLVVVVSALLALLFTIATQSDEPEPPRAAGEAAMRLVTDEHALVADFVHSLQAAAEAEQVAFARDRTKMRALALAEPVGQPAPAGLVRTERVVRAAVIRKEPVIGPPLPLQAVATTLQSQSRTPPAGPARAALAAVGQFPRWLRAGVEEAADWAVSAPARTVGPLPERRFL